VTALLTEVARKLTETWLTRLAVPGLLYLAALTAAAVLGWRHALDGPRLVARFDRWTGTGVTLSTTRLVLIIGLAVLAGTGVAMAAQGLGGWISRVWPGEHWRHWPAPARILAGRIVRSRAREWDAAFHTYRAGLEAIARQVALADAGLSATPPYDLAALYHPVARLGRRRPDRPTWVGDRLLGVRRSMLERYGLDLPSTWPALTLHLPTPAIEAVEAARLEYQRAATLAGWGLLYLPVGVLWPPGLLVTAVSLWVARRRAREAVERYSLLVEAATLLHATTLLQALGIAAPAGLDHASGLLLTRRLQGGIADA
jgi:hypothetical protein